MELPELHPAQRHDHPARPGVPRAAGFDRIYGAFFVRGKGIIPSGGKESFAGPPNAT